MLLVITLLYEVTYILQVSRAAVEGYTGEGEPPCIVMTLRAVSDQTTPPDFTLPVIFTGVDQSHFSTILLQLKGELPFAGYKILQAEDTGHY